MLSPDQLFDGPEKSLVHAMSATNIERKHFDRLTIYGFSVRAPLQQVFAFPATLLILPERIVQTAAQRGDFPIKMIVAETDTKPSFFTL